MAKSNPISYHEGAVHFLSAPIALKAGFPMTESEFLALADAAFERIQSALDEQGVDVDCNVNGAVMELEFDDGSKVIVNRHTPNQELWIAARSGGFHFARRDDQWLNARDGREFFEHLAELIAQHSGEAFQL